MGIKIKVETRLEIILQVGKEDFFFYPAFIRSGNKLNVMEKERLNLISLIGDVYILYVTQFNSIHSLSCIPRLTSYSLCATKSHECLTSARSQSSGFDSYNLLLYLIFLH